MQNESECVSALGCSNRRDLLSVQLFISFHRSPSMTYVGAYKDRLRHGQGVYSFPGGCFTYSGSWQNGRMHGQGVFTLGDNNSYEGEFVEGEMTGVGLRRWPDGSSYSGQFERGERNGQGVHLAANGDRYDGSWAENQRSGYGELVLANGDAYAGPFARHKQHGDGRITYASSGNVFVGSWVDGRIMGFGTLSDRDGDRLYEGEWTDGLRHGTGLGRIAERTESSDTIVYEGTWAADAPQVQTTRLAFKLVATTPPVANQDASSSSSSSNHEEISTGEEVEPELLDAPATLTIQSNALPTLVIQSVCEEHEDEEDEEGQRSIACVRGESGRSLRLRIFEGQVPTRTARGADEQQQQELDDPAERTLRQWQFLSGQDKELDEDTTDSAPLEKSARDAVVNDDQPQPDDPSATEYVKEESRVDEILATNRKGMARFESLRLPSTTLLGDYYLVCESLSSDAIPPVYLPLSITS